MILKQVRILTCSVPCRRVQCRMWVGRDDKDGGGRRNLLVPRSGSHGIYTSLLLFFFGHAVRQITREQGTHTHACTQIAPKQANRQSDGARVGSGVTWLSGSPGSIGDHLLPILNVWSSFFPQSKV